jgi:ditrans,polycis-polyprenyl diphosphate synthase
MKYGVCIRALGDLEMLPCDVLEAVARAVNFTRENSRAVLNVCFSYTSRHEMTEAVRRLARGTMEGMILPRWVEGERE